MVSGWNDDDDDDSPHHGRIIFGNCNKEYIHLISIWMPSHAYVKKSISKKWKKEEVFAPYIEREESERDEDIY